MKASDIQKQRIREIEEKADKLVDELNIATLTSINQDGYPRTCVMTKADNMSFKEIYFVTSKRSHLNGKATHFENNTKASVCFYDSSDSLTLIGDVTFIDDKDLQNKLWIESDRRFFSKGADDPKFRLIRFQTREATFWIDNKFRTLKYK